MSIPRRRKSSRCDLPKRTTFDIPTPLESTNSTLVAVRRTIDPLAILIHDTSQNDAMRYS